MSRPPRWRRVIAGCQYRSAPEGLDLAGIYKVVACADLPGVKDPAEEPTSRSSPSGASAACSVCGAAPVTKTCSAAIRGYPDLLSQDEDEVFAALCELRGGAYGEDAPKLVAHSGRGPQVQWPECPARMSGIRTDSEMKREFLRGCIRPGSCERLFS